MNITPISKGNEFDGSELARRILAGEKVPLEDLKQFIEASDGQLTKERRERALPTKEVDFF